ncbi:hypothetical protein, partial [Actinoallomurus iriomotensis]|uniref:hypothetical protein n=1 Tax=Actinoallomurus iriomotensis TaxID=478107 RepID=UPI00255348F4
MHLLAGDKPVRSREIPSEATCRAHNPVIFSSPEYRQLRIVVSNHAVRLGASVLALTAVFAVSACKDDAKTDDAESSPKAGLPAASSTPPAPGTPPPSPSSTAVPRTTQAAIARYITFLRAVSRSDVKTMCVIGG